jgi:riboflavin biosynthesis pyrimidine reductase
MKMTHMLRSIHLGILIGVETLLDDNPSLNCRLVQG